MASTKDIYEAKVFAANIFAAGVFRGTGTDAVFTIPGAEFKVEATRQFKVEKTKQFKVPEEVS